MLLLLSCATAHGTITATDRGVGSDNSAGTSLVLTGGPGGLSGTMSAGNVGILCLMMDNAGGASTNLSATSITDSAGNIWYVRQSRTDGTANANLQGVIYSSLLTANFTTSTSLTISFANSTTAKTWAWIEASTNVANAKVIFVGTKGSFTTAQSATAAPTQTTSDAGCTNDLVVAVGGAESADFWVADGDSLSGSWSSGQHTGVGSGNTGMSIITQTKVLSAYQAQTYNPTISSGTPDCRIGQTYFTEADAKARGFFTGGSGEATSNFGLSQPISAGSMGVLCLEADNLGSGGNTTAQPASITDTQGNTWTRRINGFCDPGAAAAGVELSIYTAPITTGLGVTDTLSCTWVTVQPAAKSAIIFEFAPSGAGTMSYVSGSFGNNSGATPTTAPTVTTSSIPNNDWVIAMTGAEADDNLTADSTSTNGAWRQQTSNVNASGSTAAFTAAQLKQVTATATQTYAPTLGASADWATGWIELNDSSVSTSNTGGFFQFFP